MKFGHLKSEGKVILRAFSRSVANVIFVNKVCIICDISQVVEAFVKYFRLDSLFGIAKLQKKNSYTLIIISSIFTTLTFVKNK